MTDRPFTIRTLISIPDYLLAEAAQKRFWAMEDDLGVIPLHVLITAQKNGGLVAGAFDERGEMIGVLFGFIGLTDSGKFKHCSHIMGIDPQIRGQRVGQALKLFQRDYVLKQGLDLVTWTYDPLEGINASLNVAKLGAITHKYYDNLYGDMPGALNAGLVSDRFEVEWWIDSPHVRERIAAGRSQTSAQELLDGGAQMVNQTRPYGKGESLIEPTDSQLDLDVETLLVEVPPVFQIIRATSMELARAWRSHTGEIFKTLFKRGYAVTDFLSEHPHDRPHRRNFYVLTRGPSPELSHQAQ